MNYAHPEVIIGRGNLRGTLIERLATDLSTGEARALVRLADGQEILVPPDALQWRDDGTYYLPAEVYDRELADQIDAVAQTDETIVVPVVEEQLRVGRRTVETGGVRVTTVVRERQEQVDEPVIHEEVDVERVPVNRIVDSAPQSRTEGDTLVIPVVEEQLVVERRLVLREEIRVTVRRVEDRHRQTVTLRREEAEVERLDPRERALGDGDARAGG